MSRHRNVRNLDIDNVLAEDDYSDEEVYDQAEGGEIDLSEMSEEDRAAMDEGVAHIYSVIGDDTSVSLQTIQETLWYYYFDKEESVNFILDTIAKQKIAQAKEASKAAASKASQTKSASKAAQPTAMSKQPSQQHAKVTSGQPKATDEDIEFLEDDDDNQMDFDMAALNFGEKKPKIVVAKAKKVSSIASTPVSSQPPSPKSSPLAKIPAAKRVDVEAEYAKRTSDKAKLNMVVIGHVDAGKSTLMGHFLYALGQVSEKTIRKYEREAQKIGKSSFAYAWVLDETGEERSRGITMDIATNSFETTTKQFTLLDAPGHRDFIPNMISGAAQADVAILVVDATTGEFEAGFDANGQTKEHALLVRSLGVQQMIVAVNKLDAMEWSKSRFEEITAKLGAFLIQAGFRKSKLYFVPVSGLTGENMVKKTEGCPLYDWYKGQTLVERVDQFEPPVRLLDKPFRMAVSDFFKGGIGSSSGVSVAGRIDAGHVQVGEQVVAIPGGEIGVVKTMQVNDDTATWGAAGDSCLMTLTGLDIMQLSSGTVLCTPAHPVPVTSTFIAQLVVFDIKVPITSGFPVILHHQSLNEPASIVKLIATIDKATGEVIKKNPRHLSKGSTATVRIKLDNRPIPLETFKDNKDLGRVMLRKGGETVAAGVVTQILTFGS
ncbi:unnamed protein product [Umbelopsis ramanniana]